MKNRRLRGGATLLIAILIIVSGCGRREKRAFFDAEPPTIQQQAIAPPLPDTAMFIGWEKSDAPPVFEAGSSVAVTVTFANKGDKVWPDKALANPNKKDGSYAVRLSYSWTRKGPEEKTERAGDRADLTKPLSPGESATIPIVVRAPSEPGDYALNFELVQELVCWFADRGGETLTTPVKVVPAGATTTP